MICSQCAREADGEIEPRCPACFRAVGVYTITSQKIIWHKASKPRAVWHEADSPRVKCPGSGKHSLIQGHAACTGCDCAHRPVGTRQRKKES